MDEDADGALRATQDAGDLGGRHLVDEAQDQGAAPVAAGGEAQVVPFGAGSSSVLPGGPDPDDTDGEDDPWTGIGRPLLIGGALTSAALSIAGAAYVAWRLNRPPGSPMARAARAVARTRLV